MERVRFISSRIERGVTSVTVADHTEEYTMTNGLAARARRYIFIFSLLWALLPLPSPARPSASAQGMAVTIIAAGPRAVQVMGEDGRSETLAFGPASAFLRRGLLVRAGEFLPGETALLRRRAGKGGTVQIALLCDPDSAAALERHRGRPLTGTLLSASSQVWVVQASDDADGVPLSLLISARSVFTAGGAAVTAAAFEPGAAVAITTRGLPSGLLGLASATDITGTDVPPSDTPQRAGFVSGGVTDVQADTVTIQDKAGVSHTVAVDGATRIKVRRQPAALAEIAAGMHISAWLGRREDASGNPIATTVSAYDAPRKTGKKIR